jgi:hypothetical protein
VRAELTTALPLPVVCASVELLGAVTGLRAVTAAQPEALARALSVTFSSAHLAGLVPAAAAAPAAPGPVAAAGAGAAAAVGGGGGGSTSPAAPLAAAGPQSPVSPGLAAGAAASTPGGAAAAGGGTSPGGPPSPLSPSASPQGVAELNLPAEVLAAAAAGLPLPSLSASASGSGAAMAVDAATAAAAPSPDLPPEPLVDRNASEPFRYMFTTQREKADNLEGRLNELADALTAAYDGIGELYVPTGTPSQNPVVYVGRVVTATEGATADAKINGTSVALEGTAADAALTGTHRVHLDLGDLPAYSLFPGQVVAVKGIAPRGDRMRVQAIYHGAVPPPAGLPAANARALAAAAESRDAGPLRVWVAAGPFCLHAEVGFTPLTDLLSELKAAPHPPDVLVLVRGHETMRVHEFFFNQLPGHSHLGYSHAGGVRDCSACAGDDCAPPRGLCSTLLRRCTCCVMALYWLCYWRCSSGVISVVLAAPCVLVRAVSWRGA